MPSVLLIVLLCSAAIFLVDAKSDVIDLSDKNFNEQVLSSELPFMVEFFAPWCGHCKSLAPEWEKAATNLKGLAPVGKVDCTVHQQLCGKYGVQGYPTIKCFSEKGKKVVDYQQARQAAAIAKYATEQIPDRIARIKDSAALDKFLEKSPEKAHILLFSAKSEISPLIKSLAVKFGAKSIFGQVKKGVADIENKYNVQSFPTILSVSGDNTVTFDGAVSSEALSAWLGGLVGEKVEEASQQEETPKPKAKPKPKVESSFSEATSETLNEMCAASLCVVGVVDAVTTEGERKVKPEHNQVLTVTLNKWGKDGKFKFIWVDRTTATQVVQRFSLGNEPSVLVFNGKRSKYAKADGFDEVSVHRMLEHVIAGDIKYQQL